MSVSLLQAAWGAKKTPQPKSGGYTRPQRPRLAAGPQSQEALVPEKPGFFGEQGGSEPVGRSQCHPQGAGAATWVLLLPPFPLDPGRGGCRRAWSWLK